MFRILHHNLLNASIWSALQRFGTLGIGFIANIVLARLLCPEDFGCVGLIMVFVGFADILVDGGLGTALVFKKNPTPKDYSTVFTTNLLFSFLLFVGIFLLAPIIASYVRVPSLALYLRVEAVAIIIRALYSIKASYLSKELRFKDMAIIGISAALISAVVSIVMAASGCGVWSLVAKNVLLQTGTMFMYMSIVKLPYRLSFSKDSFKELFGYGWFVALTSFFDLFYSNIVSFIIGKRYSVKDLGYYNQAYSLQQIPVYSISMVINQVLFPYMSKIQDDINKIRQNARQVMSVSTFMVFPLLFFLLCFGKQIIIFLYSSKWIPSTPYFQILLVGGMVNCMIHINRNILKSLGKTSILFKTQIIITAFSIGMVLFIMHYSIMALIICVVACSYINWIVIGIITGRIIGYPFYRQVMDILGSFFISAFAGAMTFFIFCVFLNFGTLLTLLLAFVCFIILYLVVHLLFNTYSLRCILNILFPARIDVV